MANTMAVSVKLPGNLVEHYLLRAVDNRIALENSVHTFETVHQLIAHYSTVRYVLSPSPPPLIAAVSRSGARFKGERH